MALTHTVFSVCKYVELGTQRAILQGYDVSALFGFWNGYSGSAVYENWITANNIDNFQDDYVISSQQQGLYRGNKQDLTTVPTNIADATTRLSINQGKYSAYTSDFGCAEIIVVNEELSLDEIECIEDYLNDKYKIIKEVEGNPGDCLNVEENNLVGWYDGDSLSIDNGRWLDKSGLANDGVISGSGLELFDGTDTGSEFYANGQKVVTGTIQI